MSDPAEMKSNLSVAVSTPARPEARSTTFTIPASPSEQDVIALMREFGRFLGLTAAACLQTGVFTPENAACTALMNSGGTLIGTAQQWQQFLAAQAQQAAQFAQQAGPGGIGGPRPFMKN